MGSMKDTLGDTPYPLPLFGHRESAKRRDAGRAKVASPNAEWMEDILALIRSLPLEWVGLLEDIRGQYRGPPPTHPNAWGSIANSAVRQGLLAETGIWRAASGVKSHARRMPEYRRTGTAS